MKLGTRSSALATVQARAVAECLRAAGVSVEIVPISTEGDRSTEPLTQIGGTGVFASALRSALIAGEIDLAVHSLKDLPVAPYPGLTLAAVTSREDPRDVVISAGGRMLTQLPPGARVGTGSPRRAGQLKALAPHVQIRDIRGNVGTRIATVAAGEFDAVVLAAAGLRRLGRAGEITEVLSTDDMLPAPGQGALAVECREPEGSVGDTEVYQACATVDDVTTRDCVSAERAMLARLEAGCTAPVAGLATPAVGGYHLRGWLAVGTAVASGSCTGSDPHRLGHDLAETLLTQMLDDFSEPNLVTERKL